MQSVQFRQQKQASMRGMPILSNSTGLLHSEQVIDLEGPIALREDGKTATIENGTPWELRSAMLVRRDGEEFRLTPLGTLEPRSVVAVDDETVSSEQIYSFLEQSPITSYHTPKGEVSLRQLYRLALDARQLADGGIRLVAWTDVELDGVKIKPGSNQRTSRVLIVSNLEFGNQREALPDANMYEDVREKQSDLFDPPES
jgi:hypothetical protein